MYKVGWPVDQAAQNEQTAPGRDCIRAAEVDGPSAAPEKWRFALFNMTKFHTSLCRLCRMCRPLMVGSSRGGVPVALAFLLVPMQA